MKRKKKGLSVFNGSFETFTKYYGRNVGNLGATSRKRNLVGGDHSFSNFFKGGLFKKGLGNPALN